MGVKIVDTCLRDGHQSLLATRLTTEDILPVATLLDKAGSSFKNLRHASNVAPPQTSKA